MDIFSSDYFLYFIIILLVLIFCTAGLFKTVISPFLKERSFIKREMLRCSGSEYRYWKHELKKLYVKYFPILKLFIK